jgi:hypothetical protein
MAGNFRPCREVFAKCLSQRMMPAIPRDGRLKNARSLTRCAVLSRLRGRVSPSLAHRFAFVTGRDDIPLTSSCVRRDDDVETHTSAFPRRDSPGFDSARSALLIRGRRECRAPGAPAAARVLVGSTRVSHHGHTGNARHSPRNGFTAYFVLSPVIGLFCHRHLAQSSAQSLTPASRRQDHTTSPSASVPFVKGTSASTASRSQRP